MTRRPQNKNINLRLNFEVGSLLMKVLILLSRWHDFYCSIIFHFHSSKARSSLKSLFSWLFLPAAFYPHVLFIAEWVSYENNFPLYEFLFAVNNKNILITWKLLQVSAARQLKWFGDCLFILILMKLYY